MGHASSPFPEDTEDLDSVLHRACGNVGAHGVEEDVRHNGAGVVLLCVSASPPVSQHESVYESV